MDSKAGNGQSHAPIFADDYVIEESPRRLVPDIADERRRYSCLTPFGRRVAAAEAARMAALAETARAGHLLSDGTTASQYRSRKGSQSERSYRKRLGFNSLDSHT